MRVRRTTLAAPVALLLAAPAFAQPAPGVRLPPAIGAAYGRLGRAILAHDTAGVKAVWPEDFAANAPNNAALRRDAVTAAMAAHLLDYRDARKHVAYVGEQPNVVIVMGHDTMVPLHGPGVSR